MKHSCKSIYFRSERPTSKKFFFTGNSFFIFIINDSHQLYNQTSDQHKWLVWSTFQFVPDMQANIIVEVCFSFVSNDLRLVVVLDIGGIADHQYLKFLFIVNYNNRITTRLSLLLSSFTVFLSSTSSGTCSSSDFSPSTSFDAALTLACSHFINFWFLSKTIIYFSHFINLLYSIYIYIGSGCGRGRWT